MGNLLTNNKLHGTLQMLISTVEIWTCSDYLWGVPYYCPRFIIGHSESYWHIRLILASICLVIGLITFTGKIKYYIGYLVMILSFLIVESVDYSLLT